MSAKFTRSPWTLQEKLSGSENHKGFNLFGGDGRWLGELSPQNNEDGNPSEQGLATASLITFAPVMYKTLEKFLKYCPLSGDMGILIRASQNGGEEAAEIADALVEHYQNLDKIQDTARAIISKVVKP